MATLTAQQLQQLQKIKAEDLEQVKTSLLVQCKKGSKFWTPEYDKLWEQIQDMEAALQDPAAESCRYMLHKEVWPELKKMGTQVQKVQILFSCLLVADAVWAVVALGAAAVLQVLVLAVLTFTALQLWQISQLLHLSYEVLHSLRFS